MITPWQRLPVSFPDDQAPLLLHHSSMSCFWAPRGPSNLPWSVTDMNDGSSEQNFYQNHHHHPDLICLWAFTLDLVPSASDQTVMGDRTTAGTKTSQHTKGADGNTNTNSHKYKNTEIHIQTHLNPISNWLAMQNMAMSPKPCQTQDFGGVVTRIDKN